MNDLLVKIAAPIGRDAELLSGFLVGAGLKTKIITDTFSAMTEAKRDAAGALLVAEEALTPEAIATLSRLLSAQPKWSDLPLLVLVTGGREGPLDLRKENARLPLGNLTLLERPLRPSSLLSAVRTALRARQRQFEVRDMTQDLEAANAEIRMSEQRARLILESTHDCIKLLDLEGNLISMNEEGQRRLGITDFGKVCGTPWMSFWRDSEQVRAAEAVQTALKGHIGSFEGFYQLPSGEETWWDVSITPVHNDAGDIINLLAVSREITSRKLAEKALLQSEKLAAVGRLVSTISHEINNPLEAVTNLIYIALHSKGLPDEVKSVLHTAEDELRRASQIVGQTLRFHRQTTGPRATSPEKLVESVLALYRGRLDNSNVKVETKYGPGTQIVCFEGEIRQVLSNLIGNAIDAMRNGGRLLVRSQCTCEHESGRKGVAITIADTGHGMNQETSRRIFDAFYSTKGDNGTGLGLWITKGIVDKHHGKLLVRSSARKPSGTVFRLFLPTDAECRSEQASG